MTAQPPLKRFLAVCRQGDAVCARKLLRIRRVLRDVDVFDDNGNTPLVTASRHGHCKLVTMLAEHGANVNATNKEGWTQGCASLLGTATKNRCRAAGPKSRYRGYERGELNAIAYRLLEGHTNMVEELLVHGGSLKAASIKEATPLYLTASMEW